MRNIDTKRFTTRSDKQKKGIHVYSDSVLVIHDSSLFFTQGNPDRFWPSPFSPEWFCFLSLYRELAWGVDVSVYKKVGCGEQLTSHWAHRSSIARNLSQDSLNERNAWIDHFDPDILNRTFGETGKIAKKNRSSGEKVNTNLWRCISALSIRHVTSSETCGLSFSIRKAIKRSFYVVSLTSVFVLSRPRKNTCLKAG